MDFEIILEDLQVENLLPKFISINFRKCDIYPRKCCSFHRDSEARVF